MINRFTVASLDTMTRTLVAVSEGRLPPDYVITGARILSTYSELMLEDREIWIKGGRIAAVKPAGSYPLLPGDHTIRYDAQGGIIAPGLVDPQVDLAASMMSACAYAEAALLNGTTTIVCDGAGIARVCGAKGINWMLSDARRAPLSVFIKVPGDLTGNELEAGSSEQAAKGLAALLDDWPETIALGWQIPSNKEAGNGPRRHACLAEALRRGRRAGGRIWSREMVAGSAAAGVADTWVADDRDIAGDCLEAGLWLFLKGGSAGSARPGFPLAARITAELGASAKRVCFCTDACDVCDLFVSGLDRTVRLAVAAGVPPAVAWSMGSLHPATHYAMDGEIGGLGHSRRADLVLLNDDFEVQNTWYGGQLVVEDKKITPALDKALSKRYAYPNASYKTTRVSRRLVLTPVLPSAPVTANVMGIVASSSTLEHRRVALECVQSWTDLLVRHELCFLTLIERQSAPGAVMHGLLQGLGLTNGAVASSVCHDFHHIVIAGSNEADMKCALSVLKDMHGGACAVRDGQVLAQLALPVAGLMSELRAPDVAQQLELLKRAWDELGCRLPFMSFCRLASGGEPGVRLTERGLGLDPALHAVPLFEPIIDATA